MLVGLGTFAILIEVPAETVVLSWADCDATRFFPVVLGDYPIFVLAEGKLGVHFSIF